MYMYISPFIDRNGEIRIEIEIVIEGDRVGRREGHTQASHRSKEKVYREGEIVKMGDSEIDIEKRGESERERGYR